MPHLPVQAVEQQEGHPVPAETSKLCDAVKEKPFNDGPTASLRRVRNWKTGFAQKESCCLRLALPGFELKDIKVTALPNQFLVQASSSMKKENKEGKVHWSQLEAKDVCRRVECLIDQCCKHQGPFGE